MPISNASRLADFSSGIGTAGAVIQVDNINQRVGIGTTNPQSTLQIGIGVTIDGTSGIISARGLSIGGQIVSSLGVGIRTAGGTVGTGATILDLRATDNTNNPILNYASDASTVTMKSYGTALTGTFAYQTWAHVALAKSNGILRMFINGIQTGQVTDSKTNTEGTLNIGQPNFTTSYRSTAYINDLRIYKGIAKYTSNFTPPTQIYLT